MQIKCIRCKIKISLPNKILTLGLSTTSETWTVEVLIFCIFPAEVPLAALAYELKLLIEADVH